MSLVATTEDEGFKVYEAAHAVAAIHIMEAQPEIRVLFTDIDMPGFSECDQTFLLRPQPAAACQDLRFIGARPALHGGYALGLRGHQQAISE